MKSLTCFLLVGFYFFVFNGFSQTPVISAEVNGDNVTLSEIGAYRNCGAVYIMEINLVDHHLDWYQLDSAGAALCYCTFDLAVTYGPLEPGDYSVNVYYTDFWSGDTIFEGTTAFTIGNSKQEVSSGIISQYQSECYTGISGPEIETYGFRIFPVPVPDGSVMNIEVDAINGDAILEIFSVKGELIFNRNYMNVQTIQDGLRRNELFPSPGIYFVRLTTGENVFIKKITVL